MLTRFHSAASPRPKYLAASLFVGVFLAGTLFAFVPTSSARMEDPQPMPEFEGIPDPVDDHVADEIPDVRLFSSPGRTNSDAPGFSKADQLQVDRLSDQISKLYALALELASWMR